MMQNSKKKKKHFKNNSLQYSTTSTKVFVFLCVAITFHTRNKVAAWSMKKLRHLSSVIREPPTKIVDCHNVLVGQACRKIQGDGGPICK